MNELARLGRDPHRDLHRQLEALARTEYALAGGAGLLSLAVRYDPVVGRTTFAAETAAGRASLAIDDETLANSGEPCTVLEEAAARLGRHCAKPGAANAHLRYAPPPPRTRIERVLAAIGWRRREAPGRAP